MATTLTRVIFFDAEGTLWTERRGRTMQEFWQRPGIESARSVFQTVPGVHELLGKLRATGCRLVVLSRHDERILPALLEEFHLSTFFDDVLINGDKGARASKWLQEQGLEPGQALMVGDREDLDIRPLDRVGIRAMLIDRPYNQHVDAPRLRRLDEILDCL